MDFLKTLDQKVDSFQDEIIKTLSDFVKIPSVKGAPTENAPFGDGISVALSYFLKKCADFGLQIKNGDGFYGFGDFGFAQEMLGVFGHLDVVPPGNNWSVPPFSGEIINGKMISRGTMDDKGALVSALFAIKALKDLGIEPKKTIRLFFGCDEESGFSCINRYLEKEKIPDFTIVVDGNFPATYYEKGIFRFTLKYSIKKDAPQKIELLGLTGGEKLNIVAGEAKAVLRIPTSLQKEFLTSVDHWNESFINTQASNISLPGGEFLNASKEAKETFVLRANGIKAHSSVAEQGLSAISILMNFLSTLDIEGKDFYDFFKKNVGFSVHGEGLGIHAFDEESGHLTVNPGMIRIDGRDIFLQFDVRYPVTTHGEQMVLALEKICCDSGITLCEVEDGPPMRTSPEGFLVKTLIDTYREMTGNDAKPATMGGNTYAHDLKEAAAFGPNHPGVRKLAHMADECVSLEDLILNTKIYARAIYRLVN